MKRTASFSKPLPPVRPTFAPLDCRKRGITLIELIVCTVIIGILSGAALPLSRHAIRLEKEELLESDLRTLREGIDRYRDRRYHANPALAEEACYPLTLDDLVRDRVLRRLPTDPMTRVATWKTISTSDNPGSALSDHRNVFDVRSLATGTALDGRPYSDW